MSQSDYDPWEGFPSDEEWKAQEFILQPAVRKALGPVSPELAWLQFCSQVAGAFEEYPHQAAKLLEKSQLGLDGQNILELVGILKPAQGLNHLLYVNNLDLQNIPKLRPLDALRAFLKVLTTSDSWLGTGPPIQP